MYVTTFYSFKGGVGRTMALVNVAVELAQRGRCVLAVDFDLEAPGLDTFGAFRTRKRRPGIVDFVTEYLDTGQAPEVERFVHESKEVGKDGGCLHIMPSGEQHARYAASFREIDWFDLYERRDGYLLFEDLKAQWEQFVSPDYVLIDSRTGHTDTGGICTRQLPDAVVVLFFPNEQNLRGLNTIVQDIRSEARRPRDKRIDLHFVLSNVPDLDDEYRILGKKIDAFREELEFSGEPLILHRYDSLSLLNQVVFTKERPRSRLAREYCVLVDEIVGRNLKDRNGALGYIKRTGALWRRRGATHESPERIGLKLHEIEDLHSDDGDVLFALGTFFEQDRQLERAALLFNRAIEAGCDEPEAYLKRARMRDESDSIGATEDALRVLRAEGVPPPLVREAVRLIADERIEGVAESVAVASLDVDERIWLANVLSGSIKEIGIGATILEPLVADEGLPERERTAARGALALHYIGLGRCAIAAELLRHGGRKVGEMDIGDAFNCGMAAWGETGEVSSQPFERAIEEYPADQERDDANFLQCMAVAHWVVGDADAARKLAGHAREQVLSEGGEEFSCWRYYRVRAEEFLEDLDEIEALINGDTSRKPRFMAAQAGSGTDPGE